MGLLIYLMCAFMCALSSPLPRLQHADSNSPDLDIFSLSPLSIDDNYRGEDDNDDNTDDIIEKRLEGNIYGIKYDKRRSRFIRIGKSVNPYLVPSYKSLAEPDANEIDSALLTMSDLMPFTPLTSQNNMDQGMSGLGIGSLDSPDKRGFIRYGKVPTSSFVRIGRNYYLRQNKRPYRGYGKVGHSSFIRIGRK